MRLTANGREKALSRFGQPAARRGTSRWGVAAVARAVALAASALACHAAQSQEYQDFRIDTRVFRAGEKEPMVETTTLFQAGFVYDFLRHPGDKDPETTIFDPSRGRFVVIDPQRKLWTQISQGDITAFIQKLQTEAAAHKDPLLNFMAAPKFKEETKNDELLFTSWWMEYRIKTANAKSEKAANEYAEFSHWHAQLNVMITPQNLPPFPRMKINDLLAERKLLPVEVNMTLLPNQNGPRKLSMRAEHHFKWTLVDSDRQRIQEAGRQLAVFQQVTLEDYNRRVADVPAGPPPPRSAKK